MAVNVDKRLAQVSFGALRKAVFHEQELRMCQFLCYFMVGLFSKAYLKIEHLEDHFGHLGCIKKTKIRWR